MTESTDLDILQFLSAEEIKARTDAKLRALIKHAYNDVPYYKEIFDNLKIHWTDIRIVEDLSLLPVLTRQTVKNRFPKDLAARSISKQRRRLTSTTGSTGVPLLFYSDSASEKPRSDAWTFLNQWAGVKQGYNRVWLGAPRPQPHFNLRHPFKTWNEIRRFKQPDDLISVFMLHAEAVPDVLQEMQRRAPYYIYGISSSIRFIARQVEEERLVLKSLPRSIIGTSDTLLPIHQEYIGKIFGCRVYSRYGSYEMGGGTAQTCPDFPGIMHVIPELAILEVVDESGMPAAPGSAGRIYLTELTNYAMPFIRYDTGDIGTASAKCACGRGFPAIQEIKGRNYEQVRTPSGHSIHGWEFEVYIFYQKDYRKYIIEYEILQKGNDIIFRLVPSSAYTDSTSRILEEDLRMMLGAEMSVHVEAVDHIEYGPNGKKPLIRIV